MEEVRITLRLPEQTRDAVVEAGRANGRSLNSEIVSRLDRSFAQWPQVTLHPAIIDRASRYPTEVRAAFEVNLSVYGEELSDKYFPHESSSVINLFHAFHSLITNAPFDKKDALEKELEALILNAIDVLPEESRKSIVSEYKAIFTGRRG